MYRIKIKYDVEVWHDIDAGSKAEAMDRVIMNTNFNPETVVSRDDISISTDYTHYDIKTEKVRV